MVQKSKRFVMIIDWIKPDLWINPIKQIYYCDIGNKKINKLTQLDILKCLID